MRTAPFGRKTWKEGTESATYSKDSGELGKRTGTLKNFYPIRYLAMLNMIKFRRHFDAPAALDAIEI